MRRNHFWGTLCLGMLAAACQKTEYVRSYAAKPEKKIETLSGKIIQLYKDTVYTLSQPLMRNAGEQLLIQEGTLIKVSPNSGSIVINKGGVLIANGTVDEPIVITSSMPTGSQLVNWGGITINGKAVDNSNPTGADPTD